MSLVLPREECRYFSTRRFPWQRVKLKAMAAAFGWRFGRRPAAAGL